jgi:NAD(P)-dependent dehydrogenase (short-subunit alcohol dehydrogenase family)
MTAGRDGRFEQPVALVTGAGGALGAAIGRRLRSVGFRLALFERDEKSAGAVARDFGPDALTIAVDQTDRAQIDGAMRQIEKKLGRLDVVVANAGYAKFGTVLDMPAADWDRHIAVNLSGTFHVCQAAARTMAQSRTGGSIVIISSALALAHSDEVAAYCASKAALLPLVRSMAAELGVYRIRVNAVLPGVVETPMTGGMLEEAGAAEDLVSRTPLGRLGRADDIADAVQFLCSQKAGFITGAGLTVDGGQSIYGEPRWRRQDRSEAFAPRSRAGLG